MRPSLIILALTSLAGCAGSPETALRPLSEAEQAELQAVCAAAAAMVPASVRPSLRVTIRREDGADNMLACPASP